MTLVYTLKFLIDESANYSLCKSVSEIQLLCQDLLDQCTITQPLSEICRQIILESESPPIANNIALLFTLILDNSDIVRSEVFSSFLWDHHAETATAANNLEPLSALDILLQSSDSNQIYIPRQSMRQEKFALQPNSTLVWKFSIQGGYDIEFGVDFKSFDNDRANNVDPLALIGDNNSNIEVIIKPNRVVTVPFAAAETIRGSYTALKEGECILNFNNNYSLVNGKYIEIATAISSQAMTEAAIIAAEDSIALVSRAKSKIYANILRSSRVSCEVDGPIETDHQAFSSNHAPMTVSHSLLSSRSHIGSLANATRVSSELGHQAAGVKSDPMTGDAVLLSHSTKENSGSKQTETLSCDTSCEDDAGLPWLGAILLLASKVPIAGRWIPSLSVSDKVAVAAVSRSPAVHKTDSGWNYFEESAEPPTDCERNDHPLDSEIYAQIVDVDHSQHCNENDSGSNISPGSPVVGQGTIQRLKEQVVALDAERDYSLAVLSRCERQLMLEREETIIAQNGRLTRDKQIAELQIKNENQSLEIEKRIESNKALQLQLQKADEEVCRLKRESFMLLHDRELLCQHDSSTQENLRSMIKMYEEEVAIHKATSKRLMEVVSENEGLYDRILELEVELKSSGDTIARVLTESGDVDYWKQKYSDIEAELRDSKRCNEDMRGLLLQLEAKKNEDLLAFGRHQKTAAELLNHCSSACDAYRREVGELRAELLGIKAQKRVLVSELRALRDLGLYEHPLSALAVNLEAQRKDEANV